GRRIDESSPMVDARLADGSRVNAIIPPLAIDGPALSIRKFAVDPLKVDDLIRLGSLTNEMAQLLEAVVKARLNVLISGGTGTGKTTLLNVMSSFIPHQERIVTIEDSAELQLQQEHVVRLETRPPNIEGQGQVTQRDLVRNSLRMRPDRILVGEVRGGEALDMMQAMNTGHDGSLTTIHANSPRDALARLETMISMAGLDIPDKAIRHQIASAMEADTVTMQEIFRFVQTGLDDQGRVQGRFGPTGIRPRFSERLEAYGLNLDARIYDSGGLT
ncbi:MAG: CpaF family protein, partial [Deltaproteobacteria bacterium]|nr:CpaF family protein [Deltaproteobacteria bacterium]